MVLIKNQNRITMKKENWIWIFLLLFLILSYLLLFYRVFSPKKTECFLTSKEEKYEKVNQVYLYYKKDSMKKIVKKETFKTKDRELLEIKRTELEKKGYTARTLEGKVKGSKEEKNTKKYSVVKKDLLEAGYTCKE